MEHLSKLHRELNQEIEIQYQNYLKTALSTFDDNKKRAIQQGIDGKTLALLTVIPMVYHYHLPLNFGTHWHSDIINHYYDCQLCVMVVTASSALDMPLIGSFSYNEVLGYVRARMLFTVLHATNLCIRGSRVKWIRMEIEDGAGLPYLPQ